MHFRFFLYFLLLGLLGSCHSTTKKGSTALQEPSRTYATKNVIILVIDGVRFSDSWGDSTFKNIPHMAGQLAPQGVFHPQFYNLGVTLTNPGHVALTTGEYQRISNNGSELPKYPSIFHYYRQHTGAPATDAWVIASKDKLEILARTYSQDSAAAFAPSVNAGVNGIGTGYRDDTTTLRVAKQVLDKYTPNLVLVNLREPDSEAHNGNWNGYLKAIRQSDRMVYDFWNWLQRQPHYKNTTTLLVTNDHGRHAGKRFENHGDNCAECRRISLLILSPDVKPGTKATIPHSQVDIAATVAELLGFPIPKRDGEPMLELFKPATASAEE